MDLWTTCLLQKSVLLPHLLVLDSTKKISIKFFEENITVGPHAGRMLKTTVLV